MWRVIRKVKYVIVNAVPQKENKIERRKLTKKTQGYFL